MSYNLTVKPVIQCVSYIINQNSSPGPNVFQHSKKPVIQDVHLTFFSPAPENVYVSNSNIPANNLTYVESNESNECRQTNEWAPVVEKTFSLKEINPDTSDSGYEAANEINQTEITDPIEPEENLSKSEPVNVNTNATGKKGKFVKRINQGYVPGDIEGVLKISMKGHLGILGNNVNLEDIHLNTSIEKVALKLARNDSCSALLCSALNKIINVGLLKDWLLLKCETMGGNFSLSEEKVTIHSANSSASIKKAVYKRSCLPLPLVIKSKNNNNYKYYYLEFNRKSDQNILKLHSYLFKRESFRERSHVWNGIKLNNKCVKKLNSYTFYPEPGFEWFVKANEKAIKRIIFFHHMVWGFLQCWVRKIVKLYKFMLTVEEVANQLAICHVDLQDVQKLKSAAARSQTFYLIGVCQSYFLYLKFFTLNLSRESDYLFPIANVEPSLVSEEPIVHYFHQYFFLNDSKNCLFEAFPDLETGKTKFKSKNSRTTRSSNLSAFLEEVSVGGLQTPDNNLIVDSFSVQDSSSNSNSNDSTIIPSEPHSECLPKNPKLLIKTRTVEEINSSVESWRTKNWRPKNSFPSEEFKTIMKLLASGIVLREEVRFQLLPLVRSALDMIYETNTTPITQRDETLDEEYIKNYFAQAVSAADKTKTFEIFLEQVYRIMQLHFTNATCRRVMDSLIYNEFLSKCSFCSNFNGEASSNALPSGSTPSQHTYGINSEKLNKSASPTVIQHFEHNYANLRNSDSQMQTISYSGSPRLKPCSVVLDRRKVEDYFKRRISGSNGCGLPKPTYKTYSMKEVSGLLKKGIFGKTRLVLPRLENQMVVGSQKTKARVLKIQVRSGLTSKKIKNKEQEFQTVEVDLETVTLLNKWKSK